MDLDWLKDFQVLVETGNFSRAADLRNVTQPAFSRRIRALEDWIGTALFERGAQGATLTAAGVHFNPLAGELLSSLDRARRSTQAVGERNAASLTIAATHALSFTFFPGWIRRLNIFGTVGTIKLISDSFVACEQMMLSGEIHFLLCHQHGNVPSNLDAQRFPSIRLGGDTLVSVCAPDADGHPAWPISSDGEEPIKMLGYSEDSGLGCIVRSVMPSFLKLARTEAVFTSHLAATLLNMALEGQGVAWLPLTLVGEALSSGRLVRAGGTSMDITIDHVLFRSLDCRNIVADRLWMQLVDEAASA